MYIMFHDLCMIFVKTNTTKIVYQNKVLDNNRVHKCVNVSLALCMPTNRFPNSCKYIIHKTYSNSLPQYFTTMHYLFSSRCSSHLAESFRLNEAKFLSAAGRSLNFDSLVSTGTPSFHKATNEEFPPSRSPSCSYIVAASSSLSFSYTTCIYMYTAPASFTKA